MCELCDNVKLLEVVVYLEKDYSRNESMWVREDTRKNIVKEMVDTKFGKDSWYYFDILT